MAQGKNATPAARRFKEFFGRQPRKGELQNVSMKGPAPALVVGRLLGVIYEPTDTPGLELTHKFGRNKPGLLVSSDGTQIFTVDGDYRFGRRGFKG